MHNFVVHSNERSCRKGGVLGWNKSTAVSTIMIQLSLKADLKQWGKKSIESMKLDMRKLNLWNTFEPRHHQQGKVIIFGVSYISQTEE